MNRIAVSLVLFFSYLFITSISFAQDDLDKSKWTFEAKKKAGKEYELIIHLKLEKGWHVYAMDPGGDGTLIPVDIKFEPASNVKLKGKIAEHGKLVKENVEAFGGIVNYYMNTVDYVQLAEVTGPATIKGTYTYQICTDKTCLPPTTKPFSITVK